MSTGTLGDWELLAALGEGGMGAVHLARKRGAGGFERLAALKTIKRELRGAEAVRTMFFDEARLLARLAHPAVAAVYDFGEDDGALFLAMEYVPGISFRTLEQRRPPASIAARAVAEALRGLHAAHTLADDDGRPLGVVHRDVTPDNLRLGFEGRAKVLDFGIALARGRAAPATEHGTLKGKPPYLAPEQLAGHSIDHRVDVWSAAVVLWELLTTRALFDGDSLFAIVRAVEQKEIVAPSAITGTLPAGLDDAVLAGLARDPAARWPTALAFADELDRIAAADELSLESYARATLEEDATAHRLWLRDALRGNAPPAPGRPSGIRTAVNTPPTTPSAPPPAPPRKRRWPYALLPLLLLPALPKLLSSASAPEPVLEPVPDALSALPSPDAASPDAARPDAAIALPDATPLSRPRRTRAPAPPTVAPTPTTPTPPAATATGTITIAADPYALIKIDGVSLGSTPLLKHPLPVGPHDVQLLHPGSGVLRDHRTVEVREGKNTSVLLEP